MKRVAVVTRPIDPALLVAEVQGNEFGAISVFVGTVRQNHEGRAVTSLDYSAYTAMAESEMSRILDEAESRFDVTAMAVEHRTGPLALGDISIAIATAHMHRQPAIECTSFVIEEIKKRAPIWKLEHYADGSREWVDPTTVRETIT